jgi:hypothetical protein
MATFRAAEMDISAKLQGVDRFMQDVTNSRQRYYDASLAGGGSSQYLSWNSAAREPAGEVSFVVSPPENAAAGDDGSADGCPRCRHIRSLQQSLRAVEDSYMSEIDELRTALQSADTERIECMQLYEVSLAEVDRVRALTLTKDKDLAMWRSRALQADEELRVAAHRSLLEQQNFQRSVAYFHERELAYATQGELAGRIEVANIEACWRSAILTAAASERAAAVSAVRLRSLVGAEKALREKERGIEDQLPTCRAALPLTSGSDKRESASDETGSSALRKDLSQALSELRAERRLSVELQNELQDVAMSELLLQETLERRTLEAQDQRTRMAAVETLAGMRLRRAEEERDALRLSTRAPSTTSELVEAEKEIGLLRRLYAEEKEALSESRNSLQRLRVQFNAVSSAELALLESTDRQALEAHDQRARILAADTAAKLLLAWTVKRLNRTEEERDGLAQQLALLAAQPTKPSASPTLSASASFVDPPLPPEIDKELRLLRRLYTEEKEALFETRKSLQEMQMRCEELEAAAARSLTGPTSACETPMMTPAKEHPSPRVVQTFDEKESLPLVASTTLAAAPALNLPPPLVHLGPHPPTSFAAVDPAVIAAAVAQAMEQQFFYVKDALRRIEEYHVDLFPDPRSPATELQPHNGGTVDEMRSPLLTDVPDVASSRPAGGSAAVQWPEAPNAFEGDIDIPQPELMKDDPSSGNVENTTSNESALRVENTTSNESALRLAGYSERPAAAHGRSESSRRTQRLPAFCSRLVQELRDVSSRHRKEVLTAMEATQEESLRSLSAQFASLRQQQEKSEQTVDDKLAAVRGMVRNLLYTSTHNQKILGTRLDTVIQTQSAVQTEVAQLVEQTSSLGSTLERQTSSFMAMASNSPNFPRPASANSSSGGPLSIKSPEAEQPFAAFHSDSRHSQGKRDNLPQPLTTLVAELEAPRQPPPPAMLSSTHSSASRSRRPCHQWDDDDDECKDEEDAAEGEDAAVLRAMRLLSGSHNSSTYAVSPISAPKAKPSPRVSFITPYD